MLVELMAAAATELGITPSGVLQDEAALRQLAEKGRAEVADAFKKAGVTKIGNRLKLEQVLRDAAATNAPMIQRMHQWSPDHSIQWTAPAATTPAEPPPAAPLPAAPPAVAADLVLGKTYHEVVPENIKVRAAPSLDADVLAYRRRREVIECDAQQGGWVRLAERFTGQAGWMLIDGRALGLGELLRRVPASARLREPPPEQAAHTSSSTPAFNLTEEQKQEFEQNAIDRWVEDIA